MIASYVQHHENEPPVAITLDLSLAEEAPQAECPLLLWVFVKIKSPDASGLCEGAECDVLEAVREKVGETLAARLGACFSGSRMSDGWLELYFYARSGKRLMDAAGEAMRDFPGYMFDTGSARDERWEHYADELYPDALMLHQIQSRRIIAELLEAGDDIALEREVEYYLFFQLPSQADRAVARLERLGYALGESVEQEGEFPYGRVLVRTQDVTEATMEACADEILEAVYDEHGIYEGWSTVLAQR